LQKIILSFKIGLFELPMKILITGGTGSIGEGAARLFLKDHTVSQIIVVSRDEFKQHQLRLKLASPKLRCVLGDIRDSKSLQKAMRGVDVVFHAAAFKHVDVGEQAPEEFVKTNILGTMNVFDCAEAAGVKKVILLSTDKAAHATSVLGMTKGIAERLMIARAHEKTKTVFCAVRLGNVLASRGSVIPLLVHAIKNKKPITLTDPKMTRFMLSIDECSQFIKFALQHGTQGDIFVKKCAVMEMGIVVEALRAIFHSRAPIKIIGRRAGERTHEILANETELMQSEDMGDYFRISANQKPQQRVRVETDYSSHHIKPLSLVQTEKVLRSLDYIIDELA